jgi:SAM-dependent methyltransferase
MKPTITLPAYPSEIADWWWKETCKQWPEHGEERILNLLRQEIVRQSDRFNKTRDFDPSAYGARDLSILAYGNFYTPRTFAACGYTLAEAFGFRQWQAPSKGPIRILDIGSGSGASSLACLFYLREWGVQNPISLEAWDYSGKSLAFLKRIHREAIHLWPNTQVVTARKDLRHLENISAKEPYDLILSSYALNEFWEGREIDDRKDSISNLIKLLKESGYLLLIEPAEGEVCRSLHGVCSAALTTHQPFFIQAPYFNGMTCPLLNSNSRYFSHEVRPCTPPPKVEQINYPLNLEIREVKFGMSILSKKPSKSASNHYTLLRIVSPIRKRKGTISFWGIGADGIEREFEWQRRSLPKEDQNFLLSLQRGDIISCEFLVEQNSSKRTRVSGLDELRTWFVPRWR